MNRILSRAASAATAILAIVIMSATAHGEEATLAVASNFTEVIEVLVDDFETASGHELTVSTGSTGQLYAQIVNGAPFDVFLAADRERPERLEEEGAAVAGSRFTYAVGKIALWSPQPDLIAQSGEEYLRAGDFRSLAIANPELAPYGIAARQTLEALGLWDELQARIVMGENIGQTHAMVATGNAQAGFVALSYVLSPANERPGSRWDVPAELYAPINQDAVLLERAKDNAAAVEFMDYLKSESARSTIENHGYGVD